MSQEPPSLWAEHAARGQGFSFIAGVDEAGRGCLAGPVVAAAVILPLDSPSALGRLVGVSDSKLLSARQRQSLLVSIERVAVSVGVGVSPSWEIDRLGIVKATWRAMTRSLAALEPAPDFVLIDGLPVAGLPWPYQAIVRGDRLCLSIAAASIVAKVRRDEWMCLLDKTWPGYGFREHKGYPTAAHRSALVTLGPSPIHRKTFAPVKTCKGYAHEE